MNLAVAVAQGRSLERNPAERILAGLGVGNPPAQFGLFELFAAEGIFLGDGLNGLGVERKAFSGSAGGVLLQVEA